MESEISFIVNYNNRNDNLGDQIIFTNLVRILAQFGRVFTRNECPEFLAEADRLGVQRWSSTVEEAANRVVQVGAPGALLWMPSKPRISSLGRSVAIGNSVIPEANHQWCNSYDWIGVRDQRSIEALRNAGYPQAHYFPDLAVFSRRDHSDGQAMVRSVWGISFRPTIPEEPQIDRTANLVSSVVNMFLNGLNPQERMNVKVYHQVSGDAPFMNVVAAANSVDVITEPLSLESFSRFYQDTRVILSNRLHCLLLGAINGALPIAVTTRNHVKLVSMFETLGWSRLIAFCDKPSEAVKSIKAIEQDIIELNTLVASTLADQQEIGMRLLRKLFWSASCRGG